jgi:gliding motility-associated-like protein
MRKALLIVILLFSTSIAFADHLKGGFFTYKYLGPGASPGSSRYDIILTLYMDCNAREGGTGSQVDETLNFTFFDGKTFDLLHTTNVSKSNNYLLGKKTDDECISGNQVVCNYKVVTYVLSNVALAARDNGYVVSYQRCCRISGVDNIFNSNTVGNTYSIKIPGTVTQMSKNSSATFAVNDTAVVCANTPFTIPFSATDPDGDELRYEFCDALTGGSNQVPAPDPSARPPYAEVDYSNGFSGSHPMGLNVSIDPVTGVISGIAPPIFNTGEYVVSVCVTELKNGVVVGTNRKELHIKVGNCNSTKPTLEKEYINCENPTLTFENKTPSSEIKTYDWDFGVSGTTTDVSTQEKPTFTYPAPGTYTVTVVTNKGQLCSETTTAVVKVYPGFQADFKIDGTCIQKPTQFTDQTVAQHGVVDKWAWNFGETTSTTDVSDIRNPSFQYPLAGVKSVRLIAGSSVGCLDTMIKQIEIFEKPPLQVLTKDTLMCKGDTTQLGAFGNGNFTWTPLSNIKGQNTATPEVWPTITTTYHVELNDNGCVNTDSIRVRVVNFVTLQAMGDTTICLTDSVQLNANTNGLRMLWTPSNEIDDPTIVNPKAKPVGASTTYTITARIGRCVDSDDVIVKTVPYPLVDAGEDATICYDSPIQLSGSTNGSQFEWTPTSTLSNPSILNPIARPLSSIEYVLTAQNPTSACPKPSHDTVLINVLPEILASAGRDTSVVVGQPMQFLATGGDSYVWSPATSLNSSTIANPTAVYDGSFESIRYKVVASVANCEDSAYITVRIFKTPPQIFIPTAFTPNSDSKNDVIRPLAVGMAQMEYFRIFNRWGQMVFSTTVSGEGWDGKINGKEQASGVYVWMVKGVDYTGKNFFAKGTVTLIR